MIGLSRASGGMRGIWARDFYLAIRIIERQAEVRGADYSGKPSCESRIVEVAIDRHADAENEPGRFEEKYSLKPACLGRPPNDRVHFPQLERFTFPPREVGVVTCGHDDQQPGGGE